MSNTKGVVNKKNFSTPMKAFCKNIMMIKGGKQKDEEKKEERINEESLAKETLSWVTLSLKMYIL